MFLHFSMICSFEVMSGLSVSWKYYMVLCFVHFFMTPHWVEPGCFTLVTVRILTPWQLANATKHGLICCVVDLRQYEEQRLSLQCVKSIAVIL